MNTDNRGSGKKGSIRREAKTIAFISVFICVYLCLILLSSCASKPTDLRTMVPADSLIYLESNDLGAALQPIIDSKAFQQTAKTSPDLSALRGIQIAVAVTGFETSEQKVTEENSVGRVQPHFVAIADTHAWNWQARSFAENQIGEFINDVYGGGIDLDLKPLKGGSYYVWTSQDGRKAYALVIDSLIYFGNDESAIDKCLAVRSGDAESLAKIGKVQPSRTGALASGYVSADGVAQIANIAGLKFASDSSEDAEVQSAIAEILPRLIRGSITDMSWTANATDKGIEDRWQVTMPADVANVLSETTVPADAASPAIEFLPADTLVATYYNLRDPQVAWRSFLLIAQKQTDTLAGKLIVESSAVFFEPFGIRNPEKFLSGIGPGILTANFDPEGEKPVAIAEIKDRAKVVDSLSTELKADKKSADELGTEFWRSANGDLAAAFVENFIVIGDLESVSRCVKAKSAKAETSDSIFAAFKGEKLRSATTIGLDRTTAGQIVAILSEKRAEDAGPISLYSTETRFSKAGMERRTVSDFGFIGWIILQFAKE